MGKDALIVLKAAFETFVSAPSSQNQGRLITAAEAFREHWIESQAASSAEPAASPGATTRYRKVASVEAKQPDGTEVSLSLQSRTSTREGRTWYVVSWRTRLGPGGPNRRFYVTSGDAWAIEGKLALSMLCDLERQGGLGDQYQDLDRRPDFKVEVADDLTESQRDELIAQITMPDEPWGADPYIVVLSDPNTNWRKVMIVNRSTLRTTFRSLTKDPDYMPRKFLRPGSEWYLDNSMQDLNVQQARVMLRELERIAISQ